MHYPAPDLSPLPEEILGFVPAPPEAVIETINPDHPEYRHLLDHLSEEQTFEFAQMGLTIKGVIKNYTLRVEPPGICHETIRLLASVELRGIIEDIEVVDASRIHTTHPTYSFLGKHKYDTKYPHKCFKCKKQLYFNELKAVNQEKDEQYLKSLWKLGCIEFYCCKCYKGAFKI